MNPLDAHDHVQIGQSASPITGIACGHAYCRSATSSFGTYAAKEKFENKTQNFVTD